MSSPYNHLFLVVAHTAGSLSGKRVMGRYSNQGTRIDQVTARYDGSSLASAIRTCRDPVYLDRQQRNVALQAVVGSMRERSIAVKIAALDRTCLHLLAAFPDRDPRHWMAIAKKESSHALEQAGMA